MAERAHPECPGFKDRWFGLKKSPYKKKLFERYRFCNRYIEGKTVLDIPCGVGWGTSLIKKALFIVGIDISVEAVAYAKKNYEKKNRKFFPGDMRAIPLKDNSMDVVICLEGFEHVDEVAGAMFIRESKRILKEDGKLIITCPVLNEYGNTTGNPYHLCEYPEEKLIRIFNENFRILLLERIKGPDGPEYRTVLANFKERRYKAKIV